MLAGTRERSPQVHCHRDQGYSSSNTLTATGFYIPTQCGTGDLRKGGR